MSSSGNITAAGNLTAIPPVNTPPPLQESMTKYQVQILATIYSLAAISIFFVCFRIYYRISYQKKILWTDVFLVSCLCLQLAVQGINIVEVLRKLKAYGPTISTPLIGVIALLLSYVAVWCLRMSVCLLFYEVFQLGKGAKIAIYSGMALSTLTSWIPFFWMLSCCAPHFYEQNVMKTLYGYCIPVGFKWYALNTAAGLVFDVGAVILPMIPIWSLNMSFGKKVSVTLLLGLGWLTVVASAIRFGFSIRTLTGGPLKQGQQTIYTLSGAIEIHIGILASCLLTTWRAMYAHLLPKSIVRFFSSLNSPQPRGDNGASFGAAAARPKWYKRNFSGKDISTGKSSLSTGLSGLTNFTEGKSDYEIGGEKYLMSSRHTNSRAGEDSDLLRSQSYPHRGSEFTTITDSKA